jgi:glycosyltransferase involved in cell wall biosynthesis
MHSLQLMNYRAPYPGNFMRSILALAEGLKKNGSSCLLLFPASAQRLDWIRQLQEDGRDIFFFSGHVVQDARLLIGLIRRHRIRILHSHFATAQMYLAASLARLACPRVASIVHVHNHEQSKGVLRNWLKRSIVGAHRYVAVSKDVREHLLGAGYRPQECICVENAVDFSRLDAPASNRDQPDLPVAKKKVLMFGFDFERKGVDVAVRALHEHDRERRMILLIVLARNLEATRAKIENMIGEVPDWIRLLPPRDDVASYYRMADVFISPSREEGAPYALLEATYCGVRVLASDISGQRGLAIPHTVAFKSEDSLGLYQALKAATECEPQHGAALIREARDFVMQRFRLDSWVEEMLRVYQSTTASPRSAFWRAGSHPRRAD